MKLYEVTGTIPLSGDVGIELEVEADNRLPPAPNYWVAKADGSLRGTYNAEYVTAGPLDVALVPRYVRDLTGAINKSNPVFSSRTSLHVHVNCLNTEIIDVWSGLLFAFIVEPSLMKYVPAHRQANKFCKAFNYAYAKHIADALKNNSLNLNPNIVKYTATAGHNLSTLGTIEFRQHPGTSDSNAIAYWTTLCNSIVKAPVGRWRNPIEMFSHLIDTDCADVLTHFDHSDKLVLNQDATYENMLLLMDAVFDTDWSRYETKKKKTAKVNALPAPDVVRWNVNIGNDDEVRIEPAARR